jgi:hypothetical protein
MTPKEIDAVMADLFDTHSFNEYGDWRTDPATSVDPIDDDVEEVIEKYSDDQPRDHGRFSGPGGGGEGTLAPREAARRMSTRELDAAIAGIQIGPDGTKYSAAHYKSLKRITKEEMVAQGMAGTAVEFRTGPGAPIAGLVSFREGGHFNPETGAIQINLDEMGGSVEDATRGVVDSIGLRGLVRHESFHARFHHALEKGFPLAESGDTPVGNFIAKNIDALEKEDGTTAYSKAWWGKVSTPASLASTLYRRAAINESLAEMHAHYPFISFAPPTYRKLNDLVDAAWKSRKPS